MSCRPQISSISVDTARSSPSAPDVVEVDRERAQKLLGHEVDGRDVGVEKAGDVALEQVGVGDVDAAQPQLHVERGGQTLVERWVGLDDVHPAADLGQVERVDHRLPLIGGSLDLRVLELPGEHVLDEVVGGECVAGLPDGDADGLIALKAHQEELVVALAEEPGESGEQPVDVGVALRLHQLADDPEEIHHHLVLPVAQGVVFQEVKAYGETVLDVVDPEDLVYRLVEDV